MIARMGDIGQGWCAECECGMTGTITTGSSNVLINGRPCVRMNDIIQGYCGHIGVLIGTSKNLVNDTLTVPLGSQFHGIFSGSVVSASNNVINIGLNSLVSVNELVSQNGINNSSAFDDSGLFPTGVM